jgi:hypothetical protein
MAGQAPIVAAILVMARELLLEELLGTQVMGVLESFEQFQLPTRVPTMGP